MNIIKSKNNTSTRIIAIAIYSLIAISIRYYFVIYKPPFLTSIMDGLFYNVLTGLGPLIGAIFVIITFNRKIDYSFCGISRIKSLISVLIPICLFFFYDLFSYNNSFSNTLITITCLIYSYCEEFGWRGYLQSELINIPILRRVSIITIIWFVWHLNFNINQSNAIFLLILFLGSWGIGQIAINTKSILACACFHAVINILFNIQMDFIKTSLIIICVISWFGIWYLMRANK